LRSSITLIKGMGVEGDAHSGATVKHRSRVAKDPTAPNLRQVHLIQSECLDDLTQKGFTVSEGQLGENITTRGVDLLQLPRGTHLHILGAESGKAVILEITGLRNPCAQIDGFEAGMLRACLEKRDGHSVRKAGVMAIVVTGGDIYPGDHIHLRLPHPPHAALDVV